MLLTEDNDFDKMPQYRNLFAEHQRLENRSNTTMQPQIPPTPAQRRLVNIGMFIQFHLAAIGHLVVWLWLCYTIQQYPTPINPQDGGYFILTAFSEGTPISLGILVAVYILFRCLLAYANFGTALKYMITIDVMHALLMGLFAFSFLLFLIVPVRLAIPIVLYSIACYSYAYQSRKATENTEMHGSDVP